jgi:[histone H3]-lysine4 N-trimethyltransferase MLL1
VHTNCALWSAEVFEEIDGSLQNVHSALSRGRLIKCSHCANKGATVGCNVRNCGEHFHYPCARQIACSFLSDKTVYCPLHTGEGARKNLKAESNFRVNRPIYVEYDRKKKKYVEPREVQFLIGSLYVENIGRIIPIVSDEAVDCLIPCDYKCQRLYWSSKEPWRIVEYSIRTYIENTSTMGVDLGRNFTIDHTLNTQLVQLGLAQISRWHNNLSDQGEEEVQVAMVQSSVAAQQPGGQYSSYQHRSGGEKSSKSRLDHNPYSGLSMGHLIDENNEEEPQANNDLLPPEIKDAIFEDLPHDILDGISMLDIFPKLMTYEDLLMDNKHENPFSLAVSGAGENSSRSDMKMENSNSSSLGGDSGDNADINFSFFSGSSFRNELKRSNSDAVSGTSKQAAVQRNKFDVVAKKRKIGQELQFFGGGGVKTKTEANDVFEKLKISQLDGADDLIEGPVLCDRCHCTYRTKDSFIRHLDNCDLFSTSESESENIRSPTNSTTTSPPRIMIQQQQQQQHHQPQVSTLYFDNANNLIGNFENIDMNAMVSSSQQQSFQILNATPISTSVPSLQYTQQSIQPTGGVTMTSPRSGTSSTTTTTTKVLNLQNFSNQMLANQRKGPQKQFGNDSNQLTLTNGINFANNITQQVNQQIPQLISVTLASPQHQQTYQTTTSTATMVRNQPILANQAKKQILPRLAQAPMQAATHGLHAHRMPKAQKALKKGPELMASQQHQPQQHHIEYSTQTLQPQQATTTTIRNLNQLPQNIIYQQPQQQPILVQQMGQPNIMSYITTGDQQNPTLQYVTIPTGNELKTANGQSFLTTAQNPMLQGTLQSLTGDPNVGANSILVSTPNGLQVLYSLTYFVYLLTLSEKL